MSDAEERTTAEDTGTADAADAAASHDAPVCQVAWCPFCFAVGAVQPIQPEVVEHLLRAGAEMLLAFRSVVDARATANDPSGEDAPSATRLEKIDLG